MDRRVIPWATKSGYVPKLSFARPRVAWEVVDRLQAGALTYAAGPKVIGAGLVKQSPRTHPPPLWLFVRAALRA